jgi:hypothetical protein
MRLGYDNIQCILAFLQLREIMIYARISRDWNRASDAPPLWRDMPTQYRVRRNSWGVYSTLPARRMRHAVQLRFDGDAKQSSATDMGDVNEMMVFGQRLGMSLTATMARGEFQVLKSLTISSIIPSTNMLNALCHVPSLRQLHIIMVLGEQRRIYTDAAPLLRHGEFDMESGRALQTLLESVALEELELCGVAVWRPLSWTARALRKMHSLRKLTYTHYSQPLTQNTTSDERALLADHINNLLMSLADCPTLTELRVDHQYHSLYIHPGQWYENSGRLRAVQLTPAPLYMAPHPALRELWLPDVPLLLAKQSPASVLPALKKLHLTSENSRLWGHGEDMHNIIRSGALFSDFADTLAEMPKLRSLTLPSIILPATDATQQQFTAALVASGKRLQELSITVSTRGGIGTLLQLRWITGIAALLPEMHHIRIAHPYTCGTLQIWASDYDSFVTHMRSVEQANPRCIITVTGAIKAPLEQVQIEVPSLEVLPSNIEFLP